MQGEQIETRTPISRSVFMLTHSYNFNPVIDALPH